MKISISIFVGVTLFLTAFGQASLEDLKQNKMNNNEILKTESHISGLQIALTHKKSTTPSKDYAVLLLHGSSFPASLSFCFPMNNYSWVDNLSENGYDVYSLDFLGYGNASRYPEMEGNFAGGKPLGRALEVYQDVDKAVNLIIQKTGKAKVHLIGHSWGGSVAALYAEKFPDKVARLVLYACITQRNDTTAVETINEPFITMTPEDRVNGMKNLTPKNKVCQLEPEIFTEWGHIWLQSDILAKKLNSKSVRFPSGPLQDLEDMQHNKSYFNPVNIKVPVLLVRGEWDNYPSNEDNEKLFNSIENAPYKKYVVIEKGTHVMHLEKSRYHLYNETVQFLRYPMNKDELNKHSIAVIFEVVPGEGHMQEYLDIAATLKTELEKIKGFISIERFQSINHPEKILSLSFWESEEAIEEWRNMERHRTAQTEGRNHIFKDYHLRVAQVIRDYGMFYRKEAPADSRYHHKR